MSSGSGDPRSDLPVWLTGMAIGLALLLIAALSYQLGTTRGEKQAREELAAGYASPKFLKVAGVKVETAPATDDAAAKEDAKPAPSGPGLEAFKTTCGGCHTLSAAGTNGAAGPNLDMVKPDDALVVTAIENGGSGSGSMPKDLLKGKEAEEVAKFVSEYAGQQ